MTTFESIHASVISGKLVAPDRILFKGHLSGLMPDGAFQRFLGRQGVLLKDFKPYVERATQALKAHAQSLAADAGRPFEYLACAHTAARGNSKEDRARSIAERDGITEGLVAVFSTLEPATSFEVRGNRATHRLEIRRAKRRCLVFYFYYVDRELGFMHARIQSWFPFTIQVYVNGREYIARQLARRGVAFDRYDNAIVQVADLHLAQKFARRLVERDWVRTLDSIARRINPWLPVVQRAGFGGYYWVADQCEIATDVLFKSRAPLASLMPDLLETGMLTFGADDVLRFLGRKPHPAFTGEITSDHKRRPEGRRVKHRVRGNSIKMYDKWSVLRIETTINHPRDFKVLRTYDTDQGIARRWVPMNKGVSNLPRYFEVAAAANDRYLEALAGATPTRGAVRQLDALSKPHIHQGRRIPKLHPISPEACLLFQAVLHGEHAIHGFRNRDLQRHLYTRPPTSSADQTRRTARISRIIAKLRGHGLVSKVHGSRLYRVTVAGHRLMSAAVRVRTRDFPEELSAAA
jgi:hypothetical protein